MRRLSCFLGVVALGLGASCAITFPNYGLGAGGATSSDSASASSSSSSGADTSSSSGCGDTSMSVMNCGACGHVCGSKNTTNVACDAGKCVLACSPNFTQCPTSESDGCVNLLTSSTNCGKCGHDCGGGVCSMGVCQAQIIATGQGSPAGVTTDKDRIYWMDRDTNTIHAVPKTTIGTTAPTVITPNAPAAIASLATDGHIGLFGATPSNATTLYFAVGTQGIFRFAADGTGALSRVGDGGPSSIVASGPYFFWLFDGLGGSVARYDTSSNAQTVHANGDTYSALSDVVADATNVYWADNGLGGIFYTPVGGPPCFQAGMPACSVLVPATVTGSPVGLAQDDANVYWSEGSTAGGLFKVSKTTKMVTKLANTGSMIDSLVSDGKTVYWIDGDWLFTTSVNAATPCAGTGPACGILDGYNMGSGFQLSGLWVDDQAVYWTHKLGPSQAPHSGTVSRLVR